MNVRPLFFLGTSNIVLPIRRSDYPPQFAGASRLTYYASLFSSIEVNATFYKLPRAVTVQNWAASVPDDFRFTFKVPKAVTHAKDLQFSFEELERFVEIVDAVGGRKGCLLVQLPPKVSRDKDEEVAAILEFLRDNTVGWRNVIEFRHPSWYSSDIYRMLKHYRTGMVEHDMPRCPTPVNEVGEGFVYLRFHGPEGTYSGSYDDAVLRTYAERIDGLLEAGKEVYVYFNNTAGEAFANAESLRRLVLNHRGTATRGY